MKNQIFELKGSYKRAFINYVDSKRIFLQSYNTIVCGVVNGKFYRFWGDYSVTTMKHINAFCEMFNKPTMNKKEWLNTPVNTRIKYNRFVYLDYDTNYRNDYVVSSIKVNYL